MYDFSIFFLERNLPVYNNCPLLLSAGTNQEDPSRHDWDVKIKSNKQAKTSCMAMKINHLYNNANVPREDSDYPGLEVIKLFRAQLN